MKRQQLFVLFLIALTITSCQTAIPASTSTPVASAIPTPTITPSPTPPAWGEGEFVIQVKSRAMIVKVHGQGPIAVIMANTTKGSAFSWNSLVKAADPERYTMVNFTYTIKEQSPVRRDVVELAAYLEGLGYEKIACLGASLGTLACGAIAQKPTTAALVMMAGFKGASYDKVTIPKLFIAAENDFKNEIENQYRVAAEPKAIQIFPGGAHATDLFATENSAEVIKTILDFLAEIPE